MVGHTARWGWYRRVGVEREENEKNEREEDRKREQGWAVSTDPQKSKN